MEKFLRCMTQTTSSPGQTSTSICVTTALIDKTTNLMILKKMKCLMSLQYPKMSMFNMNSQISNSK